MISNICVPFNILKIRKKNTIRTLKQFYFYTIDSIDSNFRVSIIPEPRRVVALGQLGADWRFFLYLKIKIKPAYGPQITWVARLKLYTF